MQTYRPCRISQWWACRPIGLWHGLQQFHLDLVGCLSWREAHAIAKPEEMRVDSNGGMPKGDVEHDIGGLAADARQRLQRLAVIRNLAAMLFDQLLRQGDDVLRLAAEQTDGLDIVPQPRPRPSATIFRGVSAMANSGRVARLTPSSVAWAESTTATSRV